MANFPVTPQPTLIQTQPPDSGCSVQNNGTTVIYLCPDSGASISDAVALQPGYIIPWSAPLWVLCNPGQTGVLNLIPVANINYTPAALFVPQNNVGVTTNITVQTLLPAAVGISYTLGQLVLSSTNTTASIVTVVVNGNSVTYSIPPGGTTVIDYRGFVTKPNTAVTVQDNHSGDGITLFYS